MAFHKIFISIFILTIQSSYAKDIEVAPNSNREIKSSIDYLNKKSWEVMNAFPDSAVYFADLQIEMARKISYKLGLINAHYIKGNAYNRTNYFDLAAKEFYRTLEYLQDDKEKSLLIIKALTFQGLGYSYEMTFNYEMASQYYQRGLQIAHLTNYERCIADLNYNLGVCAREQKDFDKALKYYFNALEIYLSKSYYEDIVDTYNILGILHKKEDKFEIAREYYEKAISIVDSQNILTSIKSTLVNNLGEIHFVQAQYEEAEKYYIEALKIAQEFDNKEKIKLFSNNLGDVYLKQKNYAEAIAYYQKSIALGNGDDRIDEEMKRAYKQLAVAYEATEQYKDALAYTHRFMDQVALLEETKDKLMVQNAQYRMKEVEWQRQLADKETLLAQLKSWLNNGLAVFALFIIVFGYVSWRLYLHYTVHREMKRILMTPISVELERLERKEKGQDSDDED